MDIFLSSRFILVEVVILILAVSTLLGTYGYDIYIYLSKIVGILSPRKLLSQKREGSVEKIVMEEEGGEQTQDKDEDLSDLEESSEENPIVSPINSGSKKRSITSEEKTKIVDLLALIKTRLARNEVTESRTLIIEGLSIDKSHRELNILLASLYERDGAYKKSEIIYKDLAEIYTEDEEILEKLAYNLMMLRKYEIAYEIQKKVTTIKPTESRLFTITGLARELGKNDEALDYARSYLKQYPRNPDILWIKAQAEIDLGEKKEAIEDLIKLKQLSPYNPELSELIQKLLMEEEMGKNFNQ